MAETAASDDNSDQEVLPGFLDEAREVYTNKLPPFIQEGLSPAIQPGDQREVLPKTKSGNFPTSLTSKGKEYLTCQAWDNHGHRYWMLAVGNDKHIVKAFSTNAIPKVSLHAWLGADKLFGRSRVAFDEDDSIYFVNAPSNTVQSSPPSDGTYKRSSKRAPPLEIGLSDSNKRFRELATIVEQAEMGLHAGQTQDMSSGESRLLRVNTPNNTTQLSPGLSPSRNSPSLPQSSGSHRSSTTKIRSHPKNSASTLSTTSPFLNHSAQGLPSRLINSMSNMENPFTNHDTQADPVNASSSSPNEEPTMSSNEQPTREQLFLNRRRLERDVKLEELKNALELEQLKVAQNAKLEQMKCHLDEMGYAIDALDREEDANRAPWGTWGTHASGR